LENFMAQPRTIRLFRKKPTTDLAAMDVMSAANGMLDETMFWDPPETVVRATERSAEASKGVGAAGYQPLAFRCAPKALKTSGRGYAKWCILTAAISFQLEDPEIFLRTLALWWGDEIHPQHPLPSTDEEWVAVWGTTAHEKARRTIFEDVLSSKYLQHMADAWEEKVAKDRSFGMEDAKRLVYFFHKGFNDPFLYKACRAVWQFCHPYRKAVDKTVPYNESVMQSIARELVPPSNPELLLPYIQSGEVVASEVAKSAFEPLKGFVRDDSIEQAARAFLVFHVKQHKIDEDELSFEWIASKIKSKTLDY
jgi:hypothetical protein